MAGIRELQQRVYRAAGPAPSRATSALAAGLAIAVAAAQGGAATGAIPADARRLDPDQPVWIDAAKTSVLVEGRVVLRDGVLELFACPAETKEHEAVVAIDAKPSLVHAGLLAVGAEEGSPARFQPDYQPPTGSRVVVRVEWSEGGRTRSARAQEWVRGIENKKEMDLPFVFAGSGFWTDPDSGRQHYLADAGDFICVSNFASAMLDVPAPSSQANAELWFEPFTERIPAVGTPVVLVLTPEPGPDPGSDAGPVNGADPPSALDAALRTLRGAAVGAGSSPELQAAWKTAADAAAADLPRLLRAMEGATPLAENWLRAAADAVVDRADPAQLPRGDLVALVRDLDGPPRGRRTALEILRRCDPATAEGLLADLVDDPSIENRHEAIARILSESASAEGPRREALLRKALRAARTLDQFEAIESRLEAAGAKVSLARELGFVTAWTVVGPFDNRGGRGFATPYPPEETLDAGARYEGHDEEGPRGPFGWKPCSTDDRLGELELNDALGPHKGAVAYLWATVTAAEKQVVEARYSTVAATRLWMNGKEVATHETYHSGSPFDQYVAPAELRPGENQLLLKVCQNEQTQPWAQEWPVQLRLTSRGGGPLERVTYRPGGDPAP